MSRKCSINESGFAFRYLLHASLWVRILLPRGVQNPMSEFSEFLMKSRATQILSHKEMAKIKRRCASMMLGDWSVKIIELQSRIRSGLGVSKRFESISPSAFNSGSFLIRKLLENLKPRVNQLSEKVRKRFSFNQLSNHPYKLDKIWKFLSISMNLDEIWKAFTSLCGKVSLKYRRISTFPTWSSRLNQ